jgi:hypothetical protein
MVLARLAQISLNALTVISNPVLSVWRRSCEKSKMGKRFRNRYAHFEMTKALRWIPHQVRNDSLLSLVISTAWEKSMKEKGFLGRKLPRNDNVGNLKLLCGP